MGNRTVITCPCGGAVVLDLSGSLKLVAPSYSLTPDGPRSMVIDLRKEVAKDNTPRYICMQCSREFDQETIKECTSTCRMCNQSKPIANQVVTSYVSPICKDCVNDAKSGNSTKMSGVFAAPPNFRTHDMATILFKKLST